ncbi:MAG: restriction endonuclease [Mangrovibacterium sp.]
MTNNNIFHYPPDLFELLVQTIPLLNKSKKAVLLFFKGAGVNENLFSDISTKVYLDKNSINKFDIVRTILERINEKNEIHLRQRREIVKRVTEFEAFTTCWENDRLKAMGLVSEVQKLVNVKDSFTRMKQERENEQKKHAQEYQKKVNDIKKEQEVKEQIQKDLYSLFGESNAQKRGKKLENVLNAYFNAFNILIKEDFRRNGEEGEGTLEQIDGIIEIDYKIFLVEMKWTKSPIGSGDIFAHLGRIYHRTEAHGIYISASGYTPSGIEAAKDALKNNALLVLFELEEFVNMMQQNIDFNKYLRNKIQKAIIDKDPYVRMDR